MEEEVIERAKFKLEVLEEEEFEKIEKIVGIASSLFLDLSN